MDNELYLIQVIIINKILKKSTYTKDLDIYEGDEIQIRHDLISTTRPFGNVPEARYITLRNLNNGKEKVVSMNTFVRSLSAYEFSQKF